MTMEMGMINDGEQDPGMSLFFNIYLTKLLLVLGTTTHDTWVRQMTAEMGTTNDGELGPNGM